MILPKPERRGPKPRKPIARGKRPARVRQRGNRGALRELADDLQSLWVRHEARWVCWVCDSRAYWEMQAAHLFAKSEYRSGRYFIENLRCLCRGCHKRYTHRPTEWNLYLQQRIGQVRWDGLRAYCMLDTPDHDYVAIAMYYRKLLDDDQDLYKIRDLYDKLYVRGRKLGVWP